ncbi:BTB/POZ protein [Chaetomium tenue]|uniref:BTB/POZ protein n=1 Tax=Chaetomium tenue TaxID=1854479 RepID=A0ACB7P461_9PEZI|nr:BTB/POZ protein [Chaetomium globosum]
MAPKKATKHKDRDEFLSSLDRLYKEGTYSDLTVTCGGKEYKVHKAIICLRSSFFETACSGPFKKGKTGIVVLSDDDPRAVELMLHFFYYFDYPEPPRVHDEVSETPHGAGPASVEGPGPVELPPAADGLPQPGPPVVTVPNLTLHAKVYALGVKYHIQGLKSRTLKKFNTEAQAHWNTNEFVRAVERVYASTACGDRGMRDAVIDTIHQHSSILDKESMQTLVKREVQLCFGLMMRFRPRP